MSSSRTRVPAASGPTQFAHPTPGWSYPGTAPGPAEARNKSATPPPTYKPAPPRGTVEYEMGPGGGLEISVGGKRRSLGSPGYLPLINPEYTDVTAEGDRIVASRLRDGYVYKRVGTVLHRTSDGSTWSAVGPCPGTTALLIPAGDGEVLMACGSAGVHRTSGWGGTYTRAQVINSVDSDILSWGLDSTGDGRCVATHYRATDYTKSRYVWYSSDAGKTWSVIADLDAELDAQWHLHFAVFDPWVDGRIIICAHSHPTSGIQGKFVRYTDNLGASWTNISTSWQPTTCVPTEFGLVMGTDDGPGGVLHANRTPDGGYGAPFIAAALPVEQAAVAYQFAVYAQSASDGTVYTTFISQVDGTPGSIVASDGVSAAEVFRSLPQKNGDGYREFGILPNGDLLILAQESVNLGTTSTYIMRVSPRRGTMHPNSVDSGRVFGGRVTGSNPFRSVAVGPYAVAGLGTDAVAVGNKSQAAATADSPQGTAVGAESKANGAGAVALGYRADAILSGATAVGGQSVSSSNAIAVGREANAGLNGVALGRLAKTSTTNGGIAIGNNAQANHTGAVALGRDVVTARADSVAVGPRDIEIQGNGKGVIMRSPNGTIYRLSVSDAGAISITPV